MSNVRSTWSVMTGRSRLAAVAGLLAVVAIGAALAFVVARPLAREIASWQPPVEQPGQNPPLPPLPSPPDPTPTPTPTPEPSPSTPPVAPSGPAPSEPAPSPTPRGPDPLLGTDGRITVLLLGSDYRPSHPGNRTDAMMVVSVDPTTGRAAAFSVPRDTVDFPLPEKGRFGAKTNALLGHLEQTTPDGYQAMKAAFSRAFKVEVDRYVFIGFAGVRQLVEAVGGVDVTLDKPYYDPYYWVTSRKRGWGLPAGTSHLDGPNALIFARSRKGDTDFGRTKRQQQLVAAALDKVRSLGPAKLPELLAIARQTVRTDLPLERADDLFELFSTVDLDRARRAIFKPRTYATGRPDGSFAIDVDACRAWVAENFPPARPLGGWPEDPAPGSPDPSAPGAP